MKNLEDVTLDDVGRNVLITVYKGMVPSYTRHPKGIIAMIKAPRGRMILFKREHLAEDRTTEQTEAIKLFMEEHSYD